MIMMLLLQLCPRARVSDTDTYRIDSHSIFKISNAKKQYVSKVWNFRGDRDPAVDVREEIRVLQEIDAGI
jgi:hypothetical protein